MKSRGERTPKEHETEEAEEWRKQGKEKVKYFELQQLFANGAVCNKN